MSGLLESTPITLPETVTDKIVPIALRLWLVFLFAFLLLGYNVVPSILFGAIGGFAGGMVSAWWQTPGGVPEADQEPFALQKLGKQLSPQQVSRRLPFLKFWSRGDRRFPGSRRL